MLSLEGKQLGNYEVIRRIRAGGMGAVYEGKQRTAFDRRVAIKVILDDYAADPDMKRRFAREAMTIARLHHPHILPLIEFGNQDGFLYLVMPYIDGGTLTSYLRHNFPDLGEVSAIYQQLLDAVEYAHEAGLIHRDIKSSNVLMEMRRSGTPYVYLADFGLVRASRQVARVGKDIPLDKVPGTPHYMAPEQTRGIITPATDIYALGVLLYQMLTGELPYKDDDDVRVIQMHLYSPVPSLSEHDASIPEELSEVVRVAMAKRPEDRFKTVGELRTAFLAALHNPMIITNVPDEQDYSLQPSPSPRRSVSLDRQPFPTPMPPVVPFGPFADATGIEEPLPLDLPPAAGRRRVRDGREAHPRARVREQPVQPVKLERSARIERPRTTEALGSQQYVTEEPVPARRKTRVARAPLLIASVVPAVLLFLLLMPHVLGVSFFPSGFPVFGTPPVANVYVTTQSKPFQGSYILTASPQVGSPNPATNMLPARVLQGAVSGTQEVQPTGTKTIMGTVARGYILFYNTTNAPVTLAPIALTTTTGVRVQLTQTVQVPPHQKASVLATAVTVGANGNIAPHTLDGTCCGNGVNATNVDSFYGGTDTQSVSVVAQADLDNVQNALLPSLEQQVMQKFKQGLRSNEVFAGNPNYTMHTASDTPIGSTPPTGKVQVTVAVQGMVSVYSQKDVREVTTQLLEKDAAQALGSGYKIQGTPVTTITSVITHGGEPVHLTVAAHGIWAYAFSQSQIAIWQQNIKGATTVAALAYLNTQQGVAGAQIQLPFNTDRFPSSIDEIKIVVLDATPTT
jgi:serine/threonine protein kinase